MTTKFNQYIYFDWKINRRIGYYTDQSNRDESDVIRYDSSDATYSVLQHSTGTWQVTSVRNANAARAIYNKMNWNQQHKKTQYPIRPYGQRRTDAYIVPFDASRDLFSVKFDKFPQSQPKSLDSCRAHVYKITKIW